jgi:hypothetical protein
VAIASCMCSSRGRLRISGGTEMFGGGGREADIL